MIINKDNSLKFSTGRVALCATLLAGLFVSCVKVEDCNQSGSGYLSFQPVSIDVSVNGEYDTKANVPEADLPSEDAFVITVSGDAIDKDLVLDHDIYMDGPLLLPVGTYTVSASYGSNAFDEPYFCKSVTVEVKENLTESVSLTDIPLANAMVKVTLPEMDAHLQDGVLTLSDGNEKITVEEGEYRYVPVNPNVPVVVSLAGTNTVGQLQRFSFRLKVQAQHAYDVAFDLKLPDDISFKDQSQGAIAGRLYLTSLASGTGLDSELFKYMISSDGGQTWSEVTPVAKTRCWLISGLDDKTTYKIKAVYGGLETQPWEFTPSTPTPVTDVTITHDYKSNTLTGSTAKATGTDVQYSDLLKGLITQRGVRLVNANEETVRTLTEKETGSLNADSSWPYLPKGSYTLQSYFVIGDETVVYNTRSVTNAAVPSFTVTAHAETSYSRYTSSDATLKAKANDAGTGDKVMNIHAKVSISDDILTNENYASLISAELKYDDLSMLTSDKITSSTFYPNTLENNETLLSGYDVISQSWDSHTVAASLSFDGFSDNDEVPCHVTGIPYSYNFYNKDVSTLNKAGWTTHNVEYEFQTSSNNKCTIQNDGSNGYLISPKFYAPENISIPLQYSIQAQYYRAWLISVESKSIQLRVGITSTTSSVATLYNTYTCKGSNKTGGKYTTYTNTDSSNPQSLSIKANQYISFSHNNANVSDQIDYLCIYGFELKYLQ